MEYIIPVFAKESNRSYVYKIEHKRLIEHPDVFDTKLIGFFSSRDDADQVVEQYKGIAGFCEYQEGFCVIKMPLDPMSFFQSTSISNQIYYLYYWRENEKEKIDYVHDIGVFSSENLAISAKMHLLSTGKYTKDEAPYLLIESYLINKCFWCEGFDL